MSEKPVKDTDDYSVASNVSLLLAPLLGLYRQNLDKMVQPYGLSAWQAPLINYLNDRDGQTPKELSKKMGIKPSSLTTMLTRMEKNGLVERRQNKVDKRVVNIYLTPKGGRASKKLRAITKFVDERNLAGFRVEERLLLLRLMEQMIANMEKQRYELELIKQDELLLNEYRASKNDIYET